MKLTVHKFYNRFGCTIYRREHAQTSDGGWATVDNPLYENVSLYVQNAGGDDPIVAQKPTFEIKWLAASDGQFDVNVGDVIEIDNFFYEIMYFKNANASYADFTTFYLKEHMEDSD